MNNNHPCTSIFQKSEWETSNQVSLALPVGPQVPGPWSMGPLFLPTLFTYLYESLTYEIQLTIHVYKAIL